MNTFRPALLVVLLAVLMVAPVKNVRAGKGPVGQDSPRVIEPGLQQWLDLAQAGEMIDVIVEIERPAGSGLDLRSLSSQKEDRGRRLERVVTGLRKEAGSAQAATRQFLHERKREGTVEAFTSFWIFNGFSVRATPDVIRALAELPGVRQIRADETVIVPAGVPGLWHDSPDNLSLIKAPELWTIGYRGQGVVVANLDTGVAYTHPALTNRWRGGTNSWFDPYDPYYKNALPRDQAGDSTGHGTATMGIMAGTDTGVAPDAVWITAKIFKDNGTSPTASTIHSSFQWLLDPDGNPFTADAPQVVNNSWTYPPGTCIDEFRTDLLALRAAGILPIFSAGNGYHPDNPDVASDASPANNPEAFSVGAVDNANNIADFSSRGPSSCDGSVFPDVTAPGVDEYTTFYNGGYISQSGTSISAPHVAGGLALLLGAFPDLTVEQQEQALMFAALDLGAPGPDNQYGYGRVDLSAAFEWLQAKDVAFHWLYFPLLSYQDGQP